MKLQTHSRRLPILKPMVLGVLLLAAMMSAGSDAYAQGFSGLGGMKTTITLDRKLPAMLKLPGNTIDIRPNPGSQANAQVAQSLSELLLVELQKNDPNLRLDPKSPDVIVHYSVMAYQTPPPVTSVRQESQLVNKHFVQVPVRYNTVTGLLTVAYRITDAHQRTLDADTVKANYSREFAAQTNQATDESLADKVTNPFKRMAGKSTDEPAGPPTAIELQQILLEKVVTEIAPRLVTTDEKVDVTLARGPGFDEANKLAQKAQWERDAEALETMKPLSDPAADAYRLYNIGVAYEAMAYTAPDNASIQKFLDMAAINYGKAIDAKPSEKYFIDPQTRIETAVAHYKKLSEGAKTKENLETASNDSGPKAETASVSTNAAPQPSVGTKSSGGTSGAGAKPSSPTPSGSALTNTDVIKMAKAGVDEDSIVAAIQDAKAVQFDLTPPGLIDLANNGVKGKLVSAMRERSRRQPVRHTGSSTSGAM
jgi:hypothetical protein